MSADRSSRHQIVRHLRGAEPLGSLFGLGIIAALQHRAFAKPLAANDDCHRTAWAALLRVNGARRHQVDLALRAGCDGGELDLRIVRTAAVIDAIVALEALGSVK